MKCKNTTFEQWGPLDEEILETDVTYWLYREEDEAPTDIPKQMYPKGSSIIDKMGYKGHGLEPQEQGRKTPISLVSYKHNRDLGQSPVPKVTIIGASIDHPFEIEDSGEEKFHEVPFEYLNDLFDDAYVNTITPITPSN